VIAAIARSLMALAVHCLGERRREWAEAMEAEFYAAQENGSSLGFALGCFVAAVRELPTHDEGRLAIASHALAFVLVIPAAALLLSSVLNGFPHSYFGSGALDGLTWVLGNREPLLSEGNRAALPPLAILIVLLAGARLRLAWLMLERDWSRGAGTAMLLGAVTMTLAILAGVVFDDFAFALGQLAVLVVELGSVAALAQRQLSFAASRGAVEK
jgi:hypothetical protein